MHREMVTNTYNIQILCLISRRGSLKFDFTEELSRMLYVQGRPPQGVAARMSRALKWMGTLHQINDR